MPRRSNAEILASRNRRYRRLGFTGYAQARRLGRGSASKAGLVASRGEMDRLPESAQDRRDDAADVVSYARRHSLTLDMAAAALGLPGADRTVPYFFPHAVESSPLGDRPTERDSHYRAMAALTGAGWVPVDTWDSYTASIVGRHSQVARDVVDGRLPASALDEFHGVVVDGRQLVADPRRLRALARQGLVEGSPYPRRRR